MARDKGLVITIIILSIILIIVFVSFSLISIEKSQPKKFKCEKPYILVGSVCCYDGNLNNICDQLETFSYLTSTTEGHQKPTSQLTYDQTYHKYFCSYNSYNCGDFRTRAEAQEAYEYCLGEVGYDVHWLDADKDGKACELLP